MQLDFPNVCPTLDSTAYVLRVAYTNCTGGPNIEFTDTFFVKKTGPTITSVVGTNPGCAPTGTITINATGGAQPLQYSINGGTSYQSGNVFSNLGGGTYNIVVRDAAGCSRNSTTSLTSVNTVTETVAKTDATCSAGGSITITAAGGAGGGYEYSINGGSSWQPSNVFNNVVPGNYTVMVREISSQCTATQAVTVALNNNLTFAAITDGSICRGASFSPVISSNATNYSWTPTTGVSNPAIANPVLTPQNTTTYTVTATLGTCSLQRTVTVNVFPGASVNAGPDVTLFAGDQYQIPTTGTAGNYLWTPSVGLSAANILAPKANPTATTTYTITVTSPQGCTASDQLTITVISYCIKVMEAFTPNGDGVNDLWLITNGNCLTNASAAVYNRYGAKVFESKDYHNDWNGMYKGKVLPDGTYYYVITFRLLNGKMQVLKGSVTILR